MAKNIEMPATLRFWDLEPTPGTAVVMERTVSERVLRSLAALGVAWLLAAVSILIPVAHFILVPGFILGGLIFAYLRLQESQTLVSVSGRCPRCKEEQMIAAGFRFDPPGKVECPGCRNDIEVDCSQSR